MAGTAAPTPAATTLDVAEQVARINKMLDEAANARAEQAKFTSEAAKLAAEASKLGRDRDLAIWQVVAATSASTATFVAGATAAIIGALHYFGH